MKILGSLWKILIALSLKIRKEPHDPAEPQEPQLALEKRVEQVPTPESQPRKFFGFERGLVPVKILGATEVRQKYMFLMRWEGSDRAYLVLASEANERCPQVVINFYVERIVYGDPMGACGSGTRTRETPWKWMKSEKQTTKQFLRNRSLSYNK
ncbi:chromobox protein homolog 1-like [Drosophila subobscura]|uniref:chromobox protein homolog 1-like n=1 Tax=Drosophila subobscura TaxID=7241 RepID=UPI00155A1B30|nr:chromobox protein homolog 1-like [Drosophila subobscura]